MAIKDTRKCNAKSKRTGEKCKAIAVTGSEKCRTHGGRSPKGVGSPNFVDGRRSKYAYLPEHLGARVGEFINDPKIVELRENIAVADARLTELYSQFSESEPAEVWRELVRLYADWQDALNSDKPKEAKQAEARQKQFEALLKQGASEASKAESLWNKIHDTTEYRRKLVESESKRAKDARQMISAEELATLIQVVLAAIKENVPDRDARNRIAEKLINAGLTTNH